MSFQSKSFIRKFNKPTVQRPAVSKKPLPAKHNKPVFELTETYKQKVLQYAYLGKKGYTIPKSVLEPEDIQFLKTDLFVKPIAAGGMSFAPESAAFPVYRENENKIYIPRFYGMQRYGVPSRSELQVGDTIDVPFPNALRDYQENIVGIYMNHIHNGGGGGILEVPCGRGKTIMALKIISLAKKKTLILVHKEFLMNQWIERMADFLPTARIGKIQGPIFDIENKDVVIGMIQTLYDKEYPANTFDSFGLTIIDEVHRIGSEQFSKTLLKTITPYMLGISATVDRKDGLTRVLHMFIGDKIYTESRENDDAVCVRAIEYVTNDSEFNKVECDFRGNPLYSTMISKLSNYVPRTEFVLRVIRDLLQEHSESQIMILAHQRGILSYIHDAVVSRGIADGSIGFYVGGMKEEALKETETKQIVLATYAMAAEALDIKTLSTLVMITPKTDIIQSVGRILRMKHDHPIVVDIVDKHENFQKQWIQRRRFYKKCNYRIRMTDSVKYAGMELDWNHDKSWKWVFEPKGQKLEESDDEDTPAPKPQIGCLLKLDDLDLGVEK